MPTFSQTPLRFAPDGPIENKPSIMRGKWFDALLIYASRGVSFTKRGLSTKHWGLDMVKYYFIVNSGV